MINELVKLLANSDKGLTLNSIAKKLNIKKIEAIELLERLNKKDKLIIINKTQKLNLTYYKLKEREKK